MIHPDLEYIDYVVESGSSDCIAKLDKLQNKDIRDIEYFIDPFKRENMEELHELYNIEKLSA